MRDKAIIQLRPELGLATANSSKIEVFQNISLRPILKFQNDLTAKLLSSSKHFTKICKKVDLSDIKTYQKVVADFISSDLVFKNRLIGVIIALMTEDELKFYLAHSSELNKRLLTMQIQRFVDNRNYSS